MTTQQTQQTQRTSRRSTALAKAPSGVLGTHRAPSAIQTALEAAQEHCILASPLTAALPPEGVAIAFSGIKVDVVEDTYQVPGSDRRALSGSTLFRVAASAGVTWDSQRSGRVDDGSDPRYCRWRAVGYTRSFDGSTIELVGEKELDMRPRAPAVDAAREQAEKSARKYAKRADTEADIARDAQRRFVAAVRQVCLHIQSHAETKAQLRAVRKGLGLRSSYDGDELRAKPLVVARAVFTGESSDPQIRRDNAAAIRESFLGGRTALYGGAPKLPEPTQQAALPPPPVSESIFDLDDFEVMDSETGEYVEPAQQQEPAKSAPARADEATFPNFGSRKGAPLAEGTMKDLEWYAGALKRSMEDPDKERFFEQNSTAHDLILEEIELREAQR